MKFLIIDHYFQHDIESLRHVASGHELRVWPASRLAQVARSYFPPSVFGSLLGEAYALPEYTEARQQYLVAARRVLHDVYMTFPFDGIISPSDTIIYLRAWVEAAHELGLPFIVLQKETAISPYTMIEDARGIGQALPFIGDLMLVCSEHHKQFWLNTGADGNKIVVAGQPRFDFYSHPDIWQPREKIGLTVPAGRPTILFFSYDLGAYSPAGALTPIWTQLRTETEKILIELAQQGCCNLIIKPHPQQQDVPVYRKHLRHLSGNQWAHTVQLIEGDSDARQLIVNAEVVVGFQTTALFEALAAGKDVVYTFWSPPAHELVAHLLPFHEMTGALNVARSPSDLKKLLLAAMTESRLSGKQPERQSEVVKHLGPLDGHSAERCFRLIEKFAADYAKDIHPSMHILRRNLDARSPVYCRRTLPLARLAVVFWGIMECLLPVVHPVWATARWFLGRRSPAFTHSRIAERRAAAEERVAYCRAVFSKGDL